jgi:hypothetical protein
MGLLVTQVQGGAVRHVSIITHFMAYR